MRFPFWMLPLPVRAAFLFLTVSFFTLPACATELTELFSAADSLSPALAEARLNVARAKSDYQAARGMPNPALFGSREDVSDGTTEEQEQTIGIQQPLGYLWSYAPKRSVARHAYESAVAAYDEARRQLQVELADRALAALAIGQRITLMDTIIVHGTRIVQAMEERFKLGDVSEYDLHRLRSELLRLHQQRFSMLAEQQQAAAEFTRLSGLPDTYLPRLTPPAIIAANLTSEEQAVETALRERPLLKAQSASRTASARAYTASKWNQMPGITIGIGRKTVNPGYKGIAMEAELELPLFTQRRSDRLLAQSAKEQAETALRAGRIRVEQEVRATYRRWLALRTELPGGLTYDTDQARLDLSRGVQMYLQGELSPVEVVDILRSTLESFDAHLQLANTRLLTELELRRVTGLPLLENL